MYAGAGRFGGCTHRHPNGVVVQAKRWKLLLAHSCDAERKRTADPIDSELLRKSSPKVFRTDAGTFARSPLNYGGIFWIEVQRGIRTFEVSRRQIYSLFPMTTRTLGLARTKYQP